MKLFFEEIYAFYSYHRINIMKFLESCFFFF